MNPEEEMKVHCNDSTLLFSSLLSWFETGELSDCTIRVGSDSNYQDFQCHKVILSTVSNVFKTMFTGAFVEATFGPEDPIYWKNVDPPVFDCTMKFVYGQVKEFKDLSFQVKMYRFAHEMQIDSLTEELEKLFDEITAMEIFIIFDLYIEVNNEDGIDKCKKILAKKTRAALDTEHFLSISAGSIQQFLSMDFLDVTEDVLVTSLLEWGKFQLRQDKDNSEDSSKLRSKILPGLKLIRFYEIRCNCFAKLCQEELGEVLSAEEKFTIFLSLCARDCTLMPTEFCKGSQQVGTKCVHIARFQRSKRQEPLLTESRCALKIGAILKKRPL